MASMDHGTIQIKPEQVINYSDSVFNTFLNEAIYFGTLNINYDVLLNLSSRQRIFLALLLKRYSMRLSKIQEEALLFNDIINSVRDKIKNLQYPLIFKMQISFPKLFVYNQGLVKEFNTTPIGNNKTVIVFDSTTKTLKEISYTDEEQFRRGINPSNTEYIQELEQSMLEQYAAKNKYLKYKKKYLQLKNSL
jgi:hypothetical protein